MKLYAQIHFDRKHFVFKEFWRQLYTNSIIDAPFQQKVLLNDKYN